MYAARAVADSVKNGYPNSDVSFMIVWIPMLGSDNEGAAQKISSMFTDARVHQFWDPNKLSGIAYSRDVFPRWSKDGADSLPPDHMLCKSLESRKDVPPEKRPLWDIALFYENGMEWVNNPPAPTRWVKQIAYYGQQQDGTSGLFWRDSFAKEPKGSDWFAEVTVGMTALTGKSPVATSAGDAEKPRCR